MTLEISSYEANALTWEGALQSPKDIENAIRWVLETPSPTTQLARVLARLVTS